jgi:hypothetical protein
MLYANYNQRTDRYNYNRSEEYKLESLTAKLNYPFEDILKAVQEVGFDRDEVEEYLRDRYNRS